MLTIVIVGKPMPYERKKTLLCQTTADYFPMTSHPAVFCSLFMRLEIKQASVILTCVFFLLLGEKKTTTTQQSVVHWDEMKAGLSPFHNHEVKTSLFRNKRSLNKFIL